MTDPGAAAAHADLAAQAASRLKPGNYEAVAALSLLSIAQSLLDIAEALKAKNQVPG